MHRVEAGESLAAIAQHYNSSPRTLASVNSLTDSEPAAGDRILIPAAYREQVAAPARTAKNGTARTSHVTRAVVASRKPARNTAATARVTASKVPVHRSAGVIAQVAHKTVAVNR
jgi:hypothetical protein